MSANRSLTTDPPLIEIGNFHQLDESVCRAAAPVIGPLNARFGHRWQKARLSGPSFSRAPSIFAGFGTAIAIAVFPSAIWAASKEQADRIGEWETGSDDGAPPRKPRSSNEWPE